MVRSDKSRSFRLFSTLLKRVVLFISSCFFTVNILSQTTNISGIINSYHSVVDIILTKSGVRVDNTGGLAYGNKVLIIQMKGATISTSNNSSFGDTTSLNNVGNYEIATVCDVIGDTVFFFHMLLNDYTVSDKIQLVKFGEYVSANVIDTVKAGSWNYASGTGGVLAISVDEDLTLNAPLFADSTGYKGGSYVLRGGTCSNFIQATGYAYDGNTIDGNQTGAYKGEGVAILSATQDGGRGAPANGGGGGNNHNNGGGGGSNLSAAGIGGGNYSTIGCLGNFRGVAGKALSSWNGKKIFPGGGGGAGHVNSNSTTHGGGNGGGIIIVITKNLIGNGYKITSGGQVGANAGSDGASGGGAGGTIIMNVTNNYTGALTIQANGGNGGTANNQNISGRCYGAGGGGSGGVIYFNGGLPGITTSVTGGNAGLDVGVTSCGAAQPASAGSNGSVITSYSYRTSLDPSNYCELLLPVRLISFTASLTAGKKVGFNWNVSNPQDAKSFTVERLSMLNGWQPIATINADIYNQYYQAVDAAPNNGENIYRLKIIAKDNRTSFSGLKKIVISNNNYFSLFPNPAKNNFTVVGKFTQPVVLQLTDFSGKLILQKSLSNMNSIHQITLPSLPAGIYLVKIENIIEKLMIR